MATPKEILGSSNVNASEDIFACADRYNPGESPVDVTELKNHYLPFDTKNKKTHIRENLFKVELLRYNIESGQLVNSYDGKRLILEVGCSTILYIHVQPSSPRHHRLFIQSEKAFSNDITSRLVAKLVVDKTAPIKKIVKYELYFLMGMISIMSVPAWLIVTGSDLTHTYYAHKGTVKRIDNLIKTIWFELSKMKNYAPILRSKILYIIVFELKTGGYQGLKSLPTDLSNDIKFKAMLSGMLFGKWTMRHANGFNMWTIVSTILIQAATKSITNYPNSFASAVQQSDLIELLGIFSRLDLKNSQSVSFASERLHSYLSISGIDITRLEVLHIMNEIKNNPLKLYP